MFRYIFREKLGESMAADSCTSSNSSNRSSEFFMVASRVQIDLIYASLFQRQSIECFNHSDIIARSTENLFTECLDNQATDPKPPPANLKPVEHLPTSP